MLKSCMEFSPRWKAIAQSEWSEKPNVINVHYGIIIVFWLVARRLGAKFSTLLLLSEYRNFLKHFAVTLSLR